MSANGAIHANFIIEQKKKRKKSECIIFERKAEKGLWQLFACRIVTRPGTEKNKIK